MKFPIKAQEIFNQFESESGEKVEKTSFDLLNAAVLVLNITYEKGKESRIKSVKSSDLFPLKKDTISDVVNMLFGESLNDFENEARVKDWLKCFLDLGNDAYKQGEIDGCNKELSVASNDSKLA